LEIVMPWRALIFALIAWTHVAAAQQSLPLANEELLHSARVWEARDRGDMAKLALEKLVAARPNSPEALLELGELNLRMTDIAAAQDVMQRLSSRFKDAPTTRTFATELRVATRDRLQLASVQRLIQIGRGREAKAELDKLFPDGAPDGMYGIEYYRLLANTPGGWERARAGLSRLVDRRPDDARYRIALARHQLDRDSTQLQGLQLLNTLAQRDDVRARDVEGELSNAIDKLGYRRVPAEILRAYSARHPDDTEVARMLSRRTTLESEERLLISTAEASMDPAAQRDNLQQMKDALLDSRAADLSFDDTIALLRALRSDSSTAIRFSGPIGASLDWARRSMQSSKTDPVRSALHKDAAVAFATGAYESAIDIAARMQTGGADAEAQELLANAARFDPGSTWLFETQVRALLDRGQIDDAIRLLEGTPTTRRWTAADRDELLATALDRRSQGALEKQDFASAQRDLERAISLAPTYPWTRFRLAGISTRDEGARLMHEGAKLAPTDVQMRYAQALYLSSVDDDRAALLAINAIPAASRSEDMIELEHRLKIQAARSHAREQLAQGNVVAARAALAGVEPLASGNLDRTSALASAWSEIGDASRGLRLFEPFLASDQQPSKATLLAWTEALDRAEDSRVGNALEQLRTRADLTREEQQSVARLERDSSLRLVRALERDRKFTQAAQRLDELLARDPDDRELRIARAELEQAAGRTHGARDLYATLAAEDPDDIDTRLAYTRALIETGDTDLAQRQLQSVVERIPENDVELQMSLARRQLSLDDPAAASATLEHVLAISPNRADAMILAGEARLGERDYAGARSYFERAETSNDGQLELEARAARNAIDARRNHWVEAGIESRHKPGDAGVSQFDSILIPTLWSYGYDYERRLTLRADAVNVDAGTLGTEFETAALLGTIQASGPTTARRYSNEAQEGLSLGLIYSTDGLNVDIGTTPLGFLLPNIVGGVEWSTKWQAIDWALGIERRAVTSSVLSYAGMRDPISGREWGGVVETGPYVQAGRYEEFFSVSGSLRYTQLNGTNVLDNAFLGARAAADWKVLVRPQLTAFAGVVLNYWRYDNNVQNYTFGNAGYYSPESYVSLAIPLEVQGAWRGWSYRVRASLTYSNSEIERAAFYPTDAALQAAAASAPLPSGFDAPYHDDEGSSGASVSGYAAVEKQITSSFVLGAKLDIDRADYYEPTIVMLYLRHTFGSHNTQIEIPPRPVRAYGR
jgi:predicted Zn-dependent protease